MVVQQLRYAFIESNYGMENVMIVQQLRYAFIERAVLPSQEQRTDL